MKSCKSTFEHLNEHEEDDECLQANAEVMQCENIHILNAVTVLQFSLCQ